MISRYEWYLHQVQGNFIDKILLEDISYVHLASSFIVHIRH